MKKCKICGKEFEPHYYNVKYCSDKCRETGKTLSIRKYCRNHAEELREKSRVYSKKIREMAGFEPHRCKICGEVIGNNRQSYCLDCLVKRACGENISERRHARDVLFCRGYDAGMIQYEGEERGYI